MKLKELSASVSQVSGVGAATAKLFAKLDIFTVADLLQLWPRSYDDRTVTRTLSQWQQGKVHTVAQVYSHEWFGFGRMRTLKIRLGDGTAQASLVCFNRPFLEKSLPVGSIVALTAQFTLRYGELQSSAFDVNCLSKDGSLGEWQDKPMSDAKVYPVYPLTAGLTQNTVRKVIDRALKEYCRGIEDEVPPECIEKRSLMPKMQAVYAVHKPETLEMALEGRRTLIYEELYHFQKAILSRSIERRKTVADALAFHAGIEEAKNHWASGTEKNTDTDSASLQGASFESALSPLQRQLLERIPFELTDDQKSVILQMNRDIDLAEECAGLSDRPDAPKFNMARLLQGDVGSGKTLVAFFVALRVVDYGGQCAMLAPTEILAKQHAENAAKMLEPLGVRVAFLTGNLNAAGRKPLLSALKAGEIDLIIGTHALFSQSVLYKNLRFAIIDEQHRFGVVQRNAILAKGTNSVDAKGLPNFLLMSATPIPQTLALTVFGDLDVSTIKSMPKGRKPIQTHLTQEGHESNVYEAVRNELKAGRQAYFVYPLIEMGETPEDGQKNALKSAEEMCDYLQNQVYPEFSIELIHSKVEEEEQTRILRQFREGKIDILVATSVVEVGVDVPNATCMVIECAQQFGLAALHQLRGRVGRGELQSQCFLIYGTQLTELGKSRLRVLHQSTDGFFIAEEDLRLRGPGDVNGIQQSGYFTLGIADPVRDKEILEQTRADVISQFAQS